MSALQKRIENKLTSLGMAWAVTAKKTVLVGETDRDGMPKKKAYHIHPDRRHPRQDGIMRFESLAALGAWLKELEAEMKAAS